MRTLYNFQISMDVKELLEKLEKNKTKHQENYELACEQYKKEVLELLTIRIKQVENNEINMCKYTEFKLPCPESYVDVYDQVIKMLQATNSTSVSIASTQFSAWVEDSWEWSDSFDKNTISYARKMSI